MVKMQSYEVKILKKKNIESSVTNLRMAECFSVARECKFNQHEVLATSTQDIGLTTTHTDEPLYREKWNERAGKTRTP